MTLFDTESDTTARSGADISSCGKYRYRLYRVWDDRLPALVFVMQNPSTADGDSDDPTIRRCLSLAKRDGFGSIIVLNVFAYRATDERELTNVDDPVGPLNDHYLKDLIHSTANKLIVAWGAPFGGRVFRSRYTHVKRLLNDARPYCLGVTKDGHPRHPLFVRGDVLITEYGSL